MIKVYLTNMDSYVNGDLVGQWVKLPASNEELEQTKSQVLSSGGDELFITAFESPFTINEHTNIDRLNEILSEVDDLEEFTTVHDCLASDLEEAYQLYTDKSYVSVGDVDDLKDAAEVLVEEGYYGEIPDHLTNFINYQAIANDMITAKGWKYCSKTRTAISR